jgi:hypothetical protein
MNWPHQKICFAIFKYVSNQFLRPLKGVSHNEYKVFGGEAEGNRQAFKDVSIDDIILHK